jgi:hypothetical protein
LPIIPTLLGISSSIATTISGLWIPIPLLGRVTTTAVVTPGRRTLLLRVRGILLLGWGMRP